MDLSERSKQIRRDTLKLGIPTGIYHYGGSFSVVEILIALYDYVLTPDDKVIMSKGHCWIPQVVILRERGLDPGFGPRLDTPSELCLVGHPFLDEANGIHSSTGSLGHGLPVGVGRALGKKLLNKGGRVYVIMGDGECQEGTFWESLLLGVKFALDNLTVIVDFNDIQGSGRLKDILPMNEYTITNAASTTGWLTAAVDGHHIESIADTLKWCGYRHIMKESPQLILARTIKGRGVSFMEDRPEWHAKMPNAIELAQAYKELR